MKTTIDIPDDLFHSAKVFAAQKRITLKQLMLAGLSWAMRPGSDIPSPKTRKPTEPGRPRGRPRSTPAE